MLVILVKTIHGDCLYPNDYKLDNHQIGIWWFLFFSIKLDISILIHHYTAVYCTVDLLAQATYTKLDFPFMQKVHIFLSLW